MAAPTYEKTPIGWKVYITYGRGGLLYIGWRPTRKGAERLARKQWS